LNWAAKCTTTDAGSRVAAHQEASASFGHNVPQEAPGAFALAVIDADHF
jgi:hypothetical protein